MRKEMPVSTTFNFSREPGRQILHEWWQWLQGHPGERAALRRAATVDGVALLPSFIDLLRKCEDAGLSRSRADAVAVIAGLLAHVKTVPGSESGRSVGMAGLLAEGGDGPVMHELRFRRLLAAQSPNELYTHLRRAMQLLGGRANLTDLADSVLFWGDRRRREWAFDYYSHAKSA